MTLSIQAHESHPYPPDLPDEPALIRTSAPDANACAGVFVLAQARDPVTDSVRPTFSNERNTLGMFGAGSVPGPSNGNHGLTTKGVDFKVTIAGSDVFENLAGVAAGITRVIHGRALGQGVSPFKNHPCGRPLVDER